MRKVTHTFLFLFRQKVSFLAACYPYYELISASDLVVQVSERKKTYLDPSVCLDQLLSFFIQ